MTKAIAAFLLAALVLVACSTSTPPPAPGPMGNDEDYLYGRHAGQPMRPAPDGGM